MYGCSTLVLVAVSKDVSWLSQLNLLLILGLPGYWGDPVARGDSGLLGRVRVIVGAGVGGGGLLERVRLKGGAGGGGGGKSLLLLNWNLFSKLEVPSVDSWSPWFAYTMSALT